MRKLALAILILPLAACGSEAQSAAQQLLALGLLRRADAAYLPGNLPGRGYLQVGNDEIELIQVAPLTGDRTLWDARWAQGEDVLLAAAIQGKKGMPAGGQCFSCTPDDMKALIRFMAGREDEQ